MEHSVLQSAAKLIVRRFLGATFKIEHSNCSTWNNRTKHPRAEGLCRHRALCRPTERNVKTKRFQQKEKEKRRFALTILTGFAII